MKKIITGILALALAGAMSVPAFAAETNNGGNTTADVQGKYQAGAEAPETISAEIEWDAMNFTYSEAQKVWNPEKHQYEQADGVWSQEKKNITVTNHSNVGITAKLSFAGEYISGCGFIRGSFDNALLRLEAATGTEVADAPTATAKFGITSGKVTENSTLGTITVTIAKDGIHEVSTTDEFKKALRHGGTIKLLSDIQCNMGEVFVVEEDTVIDLDGHKVSAGQRVFKVSEVNCTIKNGTIEATSSQSFAIESYGDLTLISCTLKAGEYSVGVNDGTTTLRDCKVEIEYENFARLSVVYIEGAEAKLIIEGKLDATFPITARPFIYDAPYGTVVMPKDIFPDIDTDYYNIVDNGDGTVTITLKQ